MTLFLLPTERRNKIRVRKGKFFDECVGMFSSFLMTLFLLQTERRNKIRVRKGKFFDECVGSMSADVSVVCRPTRWPTCLPTRRWDRILYLYPIIILCPGDSHCKLLGCLEIHVI